ncbi:MAG: hypothetical protein JNK82_15875 [Myxococcaceae bacterium]|nr:hypothetical protein [Myxococcaceae bacterium]
MDYRKFLGKEEALVLPWFGEGNTVETRDRRLKLAQRPAAPGWFTFTVKGRQATPKAAAEAPPLDALPAVRGHFLSGRLVRDGGIAEDLVFPPADEPARFAPVKARRWHSGELLFDSVEFETDAENAVREALAEDRPLAQVKGAGATLRAAFAYAVLEAAGRRVNVQFAPLEVRAHLAEVAERGAAAAEQLMRALHAEREQARREMAELERRRAAAIAAEELRLNRERRAEEARKVQRDDPRRWREYVNEKAEAALEAAGARLEQSRVLGTGDLEVIFRFMGQRFISVVNAVTFRVIDSGICLGHPPRDDLVTLESLCAVIKEAIDTDRLVILRHA